MNYGEFLSPEESITLAWRLMPRKEWDMETPVAPLGSPMVLMCPDDVIAYACETGTCMARLRLVQCEPVLAPALDPAHVLRHHIPHGQRIPQIVTQAFDVLNAALASVPVIAWKPTEQAVTIPECMLFAPAGNQVSTDLETV